MNPRQTVLTALTLLCCLSCTEDELARCPIPAGGATSGGGSAGGGVGGTAGTSNPGVAGEAGALDDAEFEARAAQLVSEMTLEEKVSQMGHSAPAISRLGVPAYNWWNEALHGVARSGVATVFPQAISLAGTFDTELMFDVATVISTEARVMNNTTGKGLTYWSPTVNLARDPRWGRNEESYGEDPLLASRLAVAFSRGMQGEDPRYLKTVSTPKHFVANNEEGRRHTGSSDVDARNLREHYFPAFKAAVMDGRAYSVMCAYNAVNGVPACANDWLLGDVLRAEWGFQGYVVSDCWAVNDILTGHLYRDTPIAASAAALSAGTDLNCGERYQADLVEGVTTGAIDESQLDRALIRLFKARFKLGEFDPPEVVPYRSIPDTELDSPANQALALRAAQESVVLLKNDGLLPLDAGSLGSVAVIGPNSNRLVYGGYSGEASDPVTPLAGIESKLATTSATVTWARGSELVSETSATAIEEAAALAAAADVALVFLGIDLALSDEERDRADIALPPVQQNLLEAVYQANTNTVLVLITGAPLGITWADENLPAIVNAGYAGQSAGTAIADVLFGDYNPAGRLPQTYHHSVAELPPFDDYDIINGGRTYMYFEGSVLYPFGHGLSYTEFEYQDLTVNPQSVATGGEFAVSFDLTNAGAFDGDEVVQVYARDVESRVATPSRKLVGFSRVSLVAGTTQRVSVSVSVDALSYYDDVQGRFRVDPGEFEIAVGSSSTDIRATTSLVIEPE